MTPGSQRVLSLPLVLAFACITVFVVALFCVRIIGAQTPVQTVTVDNVNRTFVVHLPKDYDPKKRYPVVLLLHGLGQDAEDMARLSRFNEVADRYGIIAVYPNAIRRWNVGVSIVEPNREFARSGGRRGGFGFPGVGYPRGGPGQGRRGGDDQQQPQERPTAPANDLGFFDAMLDKLSTEYSVDARRIYATGLSDGGFADFRLGCSLSNRIAAIAPVSAEMPKDLFCSPSHAVPALMINGTSDPVVSYNGGSRVGSYSRLSAENSAKYWATIDRCSLKPKETALPPLTKKGMKTRIDTYADCQQGATVALYSIKGSGNTWPGGSQYLPEKTIGKASDDLDASEVIWKFFAAQRLPAQPAASQ